MCPFQSVGWIGTGSSVIRFSLTSIRRDLFPNTWVAMTLFSKTLLSLKTLPKKISSSRVVVQESLSFEHDYGSFYDNVLLHPVNAIPNFSKHRSKMQVAHVCYFKKFTWKFTFNPDSKKFTWKCDA